MDEREPSPAAVAAGGAGSGADFADFYRQAVPSLVAFLMWQGIGLAEATDIAQETMIQAYRYWSGISHPRAWVRRVASRMLARRIASVEETVEDIGERNSLLPAGTDIEAWEEQHDVLGALRRLPSRQRQVMAWTLDGYKPTEIAEELQIAPEAVRSSLKKARRALAGHLAEAEEGR